MKYDPEAVRNWLELAYFASAPIIAILAAWGLKQITVTKRNAKLSAKREAFRLAAEQCTRFHDVITPKMNEYDEISKTVKWDWIDNAEIEMLDNGFKVKTQRKPFDEATIRPRLDAALDVVNNLDSFAVFFTSGVASESLAFSSVATAYCNQVRRLLPVIGLGADSNRHFHHLLVLFFIWNGRLKKARLIMDKKDIEERISRLGGRTVTPLGLEE